VPDDDFGLFLTGLARDDLVLTPITRAALYDPDFKGFMVEVEPFVPRPYDGLFHPSTHSLWTVRQLYLYLVAPHVLDAERMDITGVLAVTSGKFWHRFLQLLWLEDGVMVKDEAPARDYFTNRTGHADGLLRNGECVEIKTINEYQVHKIDSEKILKEKKPQYWAQTQDYLDILGLESMRYFLMHPAYPFPMTEFLVKVDKSYNAIRRSEYRHAIELAEEFPDYKALADPAHSGVPICAGCSPRSKMAKQCPVRRGCPVGSF
jgi:hypothetical protein